LAAVLSVGCNAIFGIDELAPNGGQGATSSNAQSGVQTSSEGGAAGTGGKPVTGGAGGVGGDSAGGAGGAQCRHCASCLDVNLPPCRDLDACGATVGGCEPGPNSCTLLTDFFNCLCVQCSNCMRCGGTATAQECNDCIVINCQLQYQTCLSDS
jgi:hypothetical protein